MAMTASLILGLMAAPAVAQSPSAPPGASDSPVAVRYVDAAGMLRHHIFFGAGPSLIAQILKSVTG